MEKRYSLGDVLIREQPIGKKYRRCWITWRGTRYQGTGKAVHGDGVIHQYWGKAVMYENVLMLKPWHGIHEYDKVFKSMAQVDAYIASQPAWNKTEYACLQRTPQDPGRVFRTDTGEEVGKMQRESSPEPAISPSGVMGASSTWK